MEYDNMEYDNLDTLRKCMALLPSSACEYNEWLHFGMVAKDLGMPFAEWDAWSAPDPRYNKNENIRKWQSFGRSLGDSITVGTIVQYAKTHGVWRESSRQEIPADAKQIYEWDEELPDFSIASAEGDNRRIVRSEYIIPAVIRIPNNNWRPTEELTDYISALFHDNEHVCYCVEAREVERKDGGKSWRPASRGNNSLTAGDIKQLAAKNNDITQIIGDYIQAAGAWVRVNPMSNGNGDDASVAAYRNALIESDVKTPEEQLAIIRKLNLPCAAIVHSGGKSIHAIVKVEAQTEREYQSRVDRLFKECEKAGLSLDKQNRNPSRYTRLPGVLRGDYKQFLIDTNCGAQSWEEWIDWLEEQTDDLPDMVSADTFVNNPPPLAEELIEGILRRGHKMLVSGPSKAGKSYLLLELAIAIANGGKWLGWQCAKGKVIYINFEVSESSDRNRIATLWKRYGYPSSNLTNLIVWDLRGKSRSLDKMIIPIVRRAKQKGGVSAIIIDPIYKIITGDENRAEEMGKFCNLFDELAEQCKCSVIYCHHHSKGAQGDKKAQDRASGSGVFARDPDALLDMIELTIDDQRRKTVAERQMCDALAHLLDNEMPNWRAIVPQDDTLRVASMMDMARSVTTADVLDKLTADIEEQMRGATAWRFDGILREFPPMRPTNAWYIWPVHILDTSGILADVQPEGSIADKRQKPSKKDKEETEIATFALAFDTAANTKGEATTDDVARQTGYDKSKIYKLARQSKAFEIKNGIIRRKDED